jgi:hypothetical protein
MVQLVRGAPKADALDAPVVLVLVKVLIRFGQHPETAFQRVEMIPVRRWARRRLPAEKHCPPAEAMFPRWLDQLQRRDADSDKTSGSACSEIHCW